MIKEEDAIAIISDRIRDFTSEDVKATEVFHRILRGAIFWSAKGVSWGDCGQIAWNIITQMLLDEDEFGVHFGGREIKLVPLNLDIFQEYRE